MQNIAIDTARKLDSTDGVLLSELEHGTVLEVTTKHHCYQVEYRGEGEALISGHPELCSKPQPARIHGSALGDARPRMDFIGRGLSLEFELPGHRIVRTSRIVDIRCQRPNTPSGTVG